jgi:glycosyltransferase involved in cell wall biosynthesis
MDRRTIIYSRNVNATTVLIYLKDRWMPKKPIQIFFEVHSIDQARPKKFFHRILRQTDGLISITEALKRDLITRFKVEPDGIFVSPDGVRSDRLRNKTFDRRDARMLVNIPDRFKKVVLYTGQIIPGKGVEVFIEAAAEFEDDVLFLVVGGMPESVERMRNSLETDRLKNVHFTGFVAPRSVPVYQAAADILVLPNTEGDAISGYTSPLKLFEYMAARRPIVASELPPLREILSHESNALFSPPGDARALALSIKRLLSDKKLGETISERAFRDVSRYTWEERARNILRFIEEKRRRTTK